MTALASRSDGRADGPPVVLLHAIATHGDLWLPQLGAWGASFRLVRPDFAGHGASAEPVGSPTLATMAQQVADLLDSLRVDSVALVGLSLGGMVAQAFALAHPARTRALVLAHTSMHTAAPVRALWEERLQQARAGGMETQVAATTARWLTPGFIARAPLTVEWIEGQIRSTSVAGYGAAIGAIQSLDHRGALSQVHVPTLVVAGTEDTAVPMAASQALADAMPRARLQVLQGAPHLGNVEQPVAFTELVGAFLREALT